MSTKKISLNVDEEIWDKYVAKVEQQEGTTYGKLGTILTKIIQEYYLNEKAATTIEDTQLKIDYEKLEQQLKTLQEEKRTIEEEYNKLQEQTQNVDATENKDLEEKIQTLIQEKEEKEKQYNKLHK